MKFIKKQMPHRRPSSLNREVKIPSIDITNSVKINSNSNQNSKEKSPSSKLDISPKENDSPENKAIQKKRSTNTVLHGSRIPIRATLSQNSINTKKSDHSKTSKNTEKETTNEIQMSYSKIPLCIATRPKVSQSLMKDENAVTETKSDANCNKSDASDYQSDVNSDLTSWSSVYVNFQVNDKSKRIKSSILTLLQDIQTNFDEYETKIGEFHQAQLEFKEKYKENTRQIQSILKDL